MGLFDFLKQVTSRDTRERGVRGNSPRGGSSGQRRPDERTKQLGPSGGAVPVPPPSPVYPNPLPAPNPAQRTIVRPPPRPVAPTPAPPPPRPADETIIADGSKASHGSVVGVLIAIDGPLEGEVFRIFDGDGTIGRDESCEVWLNNDRISRQHARIVHSDGTLVIKPLSDKNPTFVNDVRVEDYIELGDGDTLKLGRTTLRFRSV